MANSKTTALAEVSVPALDDLWFLVEDPGGTPTDRKCTLQRGLAVGLHTVCQGRLTTESGVAVSTSDRTSQGTIYFALFGGNLVSLYDGTRWKLYTFTERSLALSSLTSGKNYDVFLYDNSGTLTLELSAAWTDDTTRADAIALQDGVPVKNGATTRRLVGTIRTTGTTTTEDSELKRFVWSLYNQVSRSLHKYQGASASEHTYASAVFREWNNGTGGPHRIQFVTGEIQTFGSSGWSEFYGAGTAYVTLALNSSSTEGRAVGSTAVGAAGYRIALSGAYISALGFNELVVTEYSASGTSNFNYYRAMAQIMG